MITLISGSIRQDSMNVQLIEYVSGLLGDRKYQILNLRNYPIFDPNIDSTSFPPEIKDLRKQITASKALIISTPEYLHNIPAILKNFLEWLNGCSGLENIKAFPVVFSPAAPRGQKALSALNDGLLALGLRVETSMILNHDDFLSNKEGFTPKEEAQMQLKMLIKFI